MVWLSDSTDSSFIFQLVSVSKVKRRFGFVSVSQKKGGGRCFISFFPLDSANSLWIANSSGETQLKFPRPEPCTQLEQPLNSWVSPISPSANCTFEWGAYGHPWKTSFQSQLCTQQHTGAALHRKGAFNKHLSIRAEQSLYSYPNQLWCTLWCYLNPCTTAESDILLSS